MRDRIGVVKQQRLLARSRRVQAVDLIDQVTLCQHTQAGADCIVPILPRHVKPGTARRAITEAAIELHGTLGPSRTTMSAVANEGFLTTNPYFWITNLALLTFFLNFMALTFLATRSQLTSVCQNRSTALRVALVVAQISLLGWMAGFQLPVTSPTNSPT
jgi:hypothetical protein